MECIDQAIVAFHAHRYRDSVKLLEQAVKLYPREQYLRGNLAVALALVDRLQEATEQAEICVSFDASQACGYLRLAQVFMLADRLDDAQSAIDTGLHHFPHHRPLVTTQQTLHSLIADEHTDQSNSNTASTTTNNNNNNNNNDVSKRMQYLQQRASLLEIELDEDQRNYQLLAEPQMQPYYYPYQQARPQQASPPHQHQPQPTASAAVAAIALATAPTPTAQQQHHQQQPTSLTNGTAQAQHLPSIEMEFDAVNLDTGLGGMPMVSIQQGAIPLAHDIRTLGLMHMQRKQYTQALELFDRALTVLQSADPSATSSPHVSRSQSPNSNSNSNSNNNSNSSSSSSSSSESACCMRFPSASMLSPPLDVARVIVLLNRCSALTFLKRYREALELSNKLIRYNPSSEEAYVEQARVLMALQRPYDALTSLSSADKYLRANHSYHSNAGASVLPFLPTVSQLVDVSTDDDHAALMQIIERWRKRALNQSAAYLSCATDTTDIRSASQPEAQMLDIDMYVADDADFDALHLSAAELNEKGAALFAADKFDMALNVLEWAVEHEPNNHTFISNRSVALCAVGRVHQGLEDADRVLQLKEDYAKGYVRKGRALLMLRRPTEALEVYAAGLKRFPDDVELNKAKKQALSEAAEALMRNPTPESYRTKRKVQPQQSPLRQALQQQQQQPPTVQQPQPSALQVPSPLLEFAPQQQSEQQPPPTSMPSQPLANLLAFTTPPPSSSPVADSIASVDASPPVVCASERLVSMPRTVPQVTAPSSSASPITSPTKRKLSVPEWVTDSLLEDFDDDDDDDE
jgi:tetratricopeptide (TPR) repeat protein